MRDKLYVKRLTTPSGNVAHEVVALVSAGAVEAARQAREDAPRRARAREADREAARAHRERSAALWRAAESWIADNLKAAEARLARMDDMLRHVGDGVGKGSKAGW